jgi:tripartite-type tricarboxylate transporter receptor subunit TctC
LSDDSGIDPTVAGGTMKTRRLALSIVVMIGALVAPSLASGQSVAEFYNGKQIKLILGTDPGGDYDQGGRLLARYLGRHIPGSPTIIAQNMPGAASVVAANYLYNVAPRDGSAFGGFSRNIPSRAVRGIKNFRADLRRFGWVGGTSLQHRLCVALTSSPVKSIDDLFTMPLTVGSNGPGSVLQIIPSALNNVIGTKFNIVQGYKGIADVTLALRRGEVDGVCHLADYLLEGSNSDLLTDGKIRILFNAEQAPLRDHPEIPSVFDRIKNESDRQVVALLLSGTEFGRPYTFPPDVPADRLTAVRRAFAETVKDEEFLAVARKQKLDMTYISPEAMAKQVEDLYAFPKEILDRADQVEAN